MQGFIIAGGYRWYIVGLVIGVALLVPSYAGATLVSGVTTDGQATYSGAIQPEKPRQDVKTRETAVLVMIALGYSQIDARAFINTLVLAGVIN